MMYLPPLIRLSMPSRAVGGRADQIDHRPGAAVGRGDDLLRGVGRAAVDHRLCAGLLRRLALAGSMSTTMALWPPIALCSARHISPSPPAPMITVGSVVERRADLLQRAVGGDARAGERRRALRRQIADVEQIARMRHHQIIGVAAVREHAEAAAWRGKDCPRRAGRPRRRRSRSRDAPAGGRRP